MITVITDGQEVDGNPAILCIAEIKIPFTIDNELMEKFCIEMGFEVEKTHPLVWWFKSDPSYNRCLLTPGMLTRLGFWEWLEKNWYISIIQTREINLSETQEVTIGSNG